MDKPIPGQELILYYTGNERSYRKVVVDKVGNKYFTVKPQVVSDLKFYVSDWKQVVSNQSRRYHLYRDPQERFNEIKGDMALYELKRYFQQINIPASPGTLMRICYLLGIDKQVNDRIEKAAEQLYKL